MGYTVKRVKGEEGGTVVSLGDPKTNENGDNITVPRGEKLGTKSYGMILEILWPAKYKGFIPLMMENKATVQKYCFECNSASQECPKCKPPPPESSSDYDSQASYSSSEDDSVRTASNVSLSERRLTALPESQSDVSVTNIGLISSLLLLGGYLVYRCLRRNRRRKPLLPLYDGDDYGFDIDDND